MKTLVLTQAKKLIAITVFLTTLTMPAWAAIQTVTLSVPGMTCAACPITIKKALNKIPSVSGIELNLAKREVTVIFDDTRTSAEALVRATQEVGYPSTVIGSAK